MELDDAGVDPVQEYNLLLDEKEGESFRLLFPMWIQLIFIHADEETRGLKYVPISIGVVIAGVVSGLIAVEVLKSRERRRKQK